jgi:hypothetical protein
MLREAWRITWHRKSLWVFGLLAAVLSTGGVFEMAWRGLRHVESGADLLGTLLRGSVVGFETFGTYIKVMQAVPTEKHTLSVTVLGLFAIFVVAGSVLAQATLISGVREKEELEPTEAARLGKPHFWQVVLLNLLAKLSLFVVMALTTLPIALLQVRNFQSETLVYLFVLAVFLPCVVAIQTLFMFSLIAIVREQEHALNGMHLALRLFRQHWLEAMEYGLIQFLLVFAFWIAAALAFLVLLVPFTTLLMLALLSSTPVLFLLAYLIGAVGAFGFLFVVVGASTTFQYAAWSEFYERGLHRAGRVKLSPKVHRMLHKALGK